MNHRSKFLAIGTLLLSLSPLATQAQTAPTWARGIENQRKADLGDGTYLNPILPGDHADPSVLKDGDDYYFVCSSFYRYPGLLVWHSKDLINWQPVGPALHKNLGSVWAPDITKFKSRYYIYFPAGGKLYVVWADNIKGPWSEPIDLNTRGIDPGHAVGPDGKRYLFTNGGNIVALADDGLSVTGTPKKVYEGWKFPEDWVVEGFGLESPKIAKHGDYYYWVSAEGGTAGPPTSHMAVIARSKSLEGPWENSPYNPIVHTYSRDEKWWSKGHATLVEGPAGQWYLVYHAYENGFYTLGRQTMLEPVVWTNDGWPKSAGYDVAKPIPKPKGQAVPNGIAFSDDFSKDKMGVQWSFANGDDADKSRYRYENDSLVIKGKGDSPKNCSPLGFDAGDQAYRMDVEIELSEGTNAGLVLFYNEKFYAGLGFDSKNFIRFRRGTDNKTGSVPKEAGNKLSLRLVNNHDVVSFAYSVDGRTWTPFMQGVEVSGYHHNVAGGFLSLRPAIYAAGNGEVRFKNFKYQALP